MVGKAMSFLSEHPDGPLAAAAKDPGEAIAEFGKNLPAEFKIEKPTRALQISWMEKSRLKWLTEKRQKAIYNHFVYNGKLPLKLANGSYKFIRLSEREGYKNQVFGVEEKETGVRTKKKKQKQGALEAALAAAAEMLTAQVLDMETPNMAEYESCLNGKGCPSEPMECVDDIYPDDHPGVMYD
jgi:hypothetical protein